MNATQPSYDDLIAALKSDQHSGSTQLAIATLDNLYRYLDNSATQDISQLNQLVEDLTIVRPSMIVIANALSYWLDRASLSKTADEFKTYYLDALLQVRQQLLEATQRVAQHCGALVKPGMTLMTHSLSSQIQALIAHLSQQHIDFNMIITVSAPGNEGIRLAQTLNDMYIPTKLITDAEIGLFMPEVDINFSGCDSWLSDHHYVNKSGTLLQALAARHYGKPFWVLADSFKNSHQTSEDVSLETMPASEIHAPLGSFVRIENVYFETIPTRLISGRIDETGLQPNL